ncbi:metallophosphoesterase, PPA1498 family [Geodermatophilus obscurus]|uniref:Metallophosphoesterase, PPA1498 family n=1 Tax=Geodermatophilus obscurus TaxID=1861 RepID=A0A1I5GNY9_9ACTN|nr:TIGR03767 family metallophosphoesterase [Geodermatophilus obscurus]SFO37566.1 metallophosphoesterase, PPA1498 family [Geodermatophilus obscurus]
MSRTTLDRVLAAGPVLHRGRDGDYRALAWAGGEPHRVRRELVGPAWEPPRRGVRALACLAHVTDLQLADVCSPVRFEFFHRFETDPRMRALVPMHRPQEALTAHAVDALVRTLNGLRGAPRSGEPLQVVVTTGDAIDNAQWNELELFLAVLRGGVVSPGAGLTAYDGVQASGWPHDLFWRPDDDGGLHHERFGFPARPGLLEAAFATFTAEGLRVPWLGCHGNHEALIQGVGVPTPALSAVLGAGRKPVDVDPALALDDALALFTHSSEVFTTATSRPVTPVADRRFIDRRSFVAAHLADPGTPAGHGFTEDNLREGTAFYAWDGVPGVRVVCVDTTRVTGGADGAVDAAQARWLEERLREVSSSAPGPDGTRVATGNADRLVVLLSHHGSSTLTRPAGGDGAGGAALGAAELLALLHRWPNVVLWLNGHTHVSEVRAWPHPDEPGRGLWEVATCAVVDWPGQARLVEVLANGDGTLSLVCTMVDHGSPARPPAAADPAAREPAALASLHRELAANVPWAGLGAGLAGTPADRNVELVLRAPF